MAFPIAQPRAEEKPGLINGQAPGSMEEWRFAKALWRYGWTFNFQAKYFGGRLLAGGQVVDFLVNTVPVPTPVFVDGDYWHGSPRAQEEDALERASLSGALQGQVANFIVVKGSEVDTQEAANSTVARLFGRAS